MNEWIFTFTFTMASGCFATEKAIKKNNYIKLQKATKEKKKNQVFSKMSKRK